MKSLKKAAVLYHYPCPDGAFAALAAHLYFSAASLPVSFFPNTVYDPIRVDSLPLEELSDVYLLDYIGPFGFVAEVSSRVDSVTILDHHKTALQTFSGKTSAYKNVSKVIDMERSGATIAYDYFSEKLLRRGMLLGNHGGGGSNGQLLPEDKVDKVCKLFKFIEDGDLWRWALPHSRAFSSGLKDMNIEYNPNVNSSLFDQLMNLDSELIISRGQKTLDYKQKLIDEALEQSYEIALGCGLFGHCLAVHADSISELRSELGHQLANKSRNLNLRRNITFHSDPTTSADLETIPLAATTQPETDSIDDVVDIRTTQTRHGIHMRFLVPWSGRPLTDCSWIEANELLRRRPDIFPRVIDAFSSGDEVLPPGGN